MSCRDLNLGLEFRFLGQFSIRGPGGWQAGPSLKKGGELLQYLGIYPRRIATKDELAAAFWPELDPEAVAHRLHLAASGARGYLRRMLGASDAIVAVTATGLGARVRLLTGDPDDLNALTAGMPNVTVVPI